MTDAPMTTDTDYAVIRVTGVTTLEVDDFDYAPMTADDVAEATEAPECPIARQEFDMMAARHETPLLYIASSLYNVSVGLPRHGSLSTMLAVFSNEVAKANADHTRQAAEIERLKELESLMIDLMVQASNIAQCDHPSPVLQNLVIEKINAINEHYDAAALMES